MRGSLDTNVIIHFYRAHLQSILFEMFEDGVFIYEQIRSIELEHHGKMILLNVDSDIKSGKIEVYTNDKLKEQGVYKIFETYVKENKLLYGTGDLGEVYAISLAQTIGAYSLVTDDVKQGGPYMSLLQLDYDVMPFNFVDILILRYLSGKADEYQTTVDFKLINEASDLNWSLKGHLVRFVKRFLKEPYKKEEKEWFETWAWNNHIDVMSKLKRLSNLVN